MNSLNIWNKINQKCTFFLGIVGLVGILVATAGVFTRFVLKISIPWSDELLRTIFVWGYFIGAAFCFEEGGIMHLELVEDSLKKHHKLMAHKVLAVISDVISLVFFCGICVLCIRDLRNARRTGNDQRYQQYACMGFACFLRSLLRTHRSHCCPQSDS